MAAKTRPSGRGKDELKSRIVEAAVELAEEVGWGGVRFRIVGERLGVPLCEVTAHYRDLDAVADAWFASARDAMLAPKAPDFVSLSAKERLYLVIMRWFDSLAGHRRVTGQMIAAKLHPFHPHHWAPMLINLSRTVHWIREAALLDSSSPQRQIEEIGLTAIFLATLVAWLSDESPDQEETRRLLRRRLDSAGQIMLRRRGGIYRLNAVERRR